MVHLGRLIALIGFDFFLFLGASLPSFFCKDFFQIVGQGAVEVVLPHSDLALVVKRRHRREKRGVRADVNTKDTARHFRQRSHQVGVVPDLAGRNSEDSKHLGDPVSAADKDFVPFRMRHHTAHPARKRPRRDRRDVIDEAFGLDMSQLAGHVAGNGNEMFSVGSECRIANPVFVGALKENLFARLRIDRPDDVVRRTERDLRSVRRPTQSGQRDIGDLPRE